MYEKSLVIALNWEAR